jgi:5'-deoxynucleotidase YfbR-like HD superfamily hydrolase
MSYLLGYLYENLLIRKHMNFETKKLIGVLDTMDKTNMTKTTFTANFGRNYDLLNFKDEDVDINFIAMSLAKQCRYIGHVGESPSEILSVAQHSVMMAEAVLLVTGDPKLAMETLMHDSAEAYFGDIASPLKNLVKDVVKPMEENIERVIFEHFGLTHPLNPLIKKVDINICNYELTFAVHNDEPEKNTYDFWSVADSYFKFFAMFSRLEKLMEIDKERNRYRVFEFKNTCLFSAVFLKEYVGVDLKHKGNIALDLQNRTYFEVPLMEETGRHLCKDFLDLVEEILENHPSFINSVKCFLEKVEFLGDGNIKYVDSFCATNDENRLQKLVKKFNDTASDQFVDDKSFVFFYGRDKVALALLHGSLGIPIPTSYMDGVLVRIDLQNNNVMMVNEPTPEGRVVYDVLDLLEEIFLRQKEFKSKAKEFIRNNIVNNGGKLNSPFASSVNYDENRLHALVQSYLSDI